MRAIEFPAVIKDEKIEIPEKFKGKIESNKKLRVIILIGEEENEGDWKMMTTQQFFNGYSEEDALYDNL